MDPSIRPWSVHGPSIPTSAYRGVSWFKQTGKWFAQIGHQGRHENLGCFADEGDAARAYDVRARQLHGASAQLNFPGEGERQGTALQRVDPHSRLLSCCY
jgi:hypothetical protein